MYADPVVISPYARAPMGSLQGTFEDMKATELGVTVAREAVARASVSSDAVGRIYMGCVLAAGLGNAPVRQAALSAGLSLGTRATTLNKMCGSGRQAAIMAADALAARPADVVMASGMESMSNAPRLLQKHRGGARIGYDLFVGHI